MTTNRLLRSFLAAVMAVSVGGIASADLRLGSLFQDHMVLQRDKPIKVWGWSTVGDKVVVSLGGKSASAVADATGKWMVALLAMPAGGPHELIVRGAEAISVKDVLIGEVWICSGQSNMSFCVKRFKNYAEEIANANYPRIRHFMVSYTDCTKPQKDVIGAWAVCSPKTVARFTATGYFFGLELHKALGVPIGLINSSVGGTTVEQWTDAATLEANPDNEPYIKKRQAAIESETIELLQAYQKSAKEHLSLVGVNPSSVFGDNEGAFMKPDLSDGAWEPMKLPQSWQEAGLRLCRVVWHAREVELPSDMIGKELILKLGSVNEVEITYWNGIRIGSQLYGRDGSVHKVPADLVKEGKNVLAVRCTGYRGGGGFTKGSGMTISSADGKSISIAGDAWKYCIYAKALLYPKGLVKGAGSGLYNGMIHPLIPYTIRGVIWYQGEYNTGRAYQYQKQFPEMIRAWRKSWGQGEFPFYYVQLANFKARQTAPPMKGEHGWPALREAQMMALSLPNVEQACIIDIGELGVHPRNIHPSNKWDVGKRLALVARDKIYGEDIVSSGPMYDSMCVTGSRIVVKFKAVGSGLIMAGVRSRYDHTIIPLPTHPEGTGVAGFTIAGDDGKFVFAKARIVGKDSVAVWSDYVPKPVHVRFAWHANPLHNLYNIEKLPASPFRTDKIELAGLFERKPERGNRRRGFPCVFGSRLSGPLCIVAACGLAAKGSAGGTRMRAWPRWPRPAADAGPNRVPLVSASTTSRTTSEAASTQVIGPCRIRTYDQGIMSPLL